MAARTTEDDITGLWKKAAQYDAPVHCMEVCGTHTMAAFRTGLRSRLPETIHLHSGPGCPVCVTAQHYIDSAQALASEHEVTVATFGDMIRVPGTYDSLAHTRARGASVKVVYSPQQALAVARDNPDKEVVFLGIGFETTTPAVAWTIQQADAEGLGNYSVLCAHKTIPPAMHALCSSPDVRIDGFLCPGHVSVITGARIYEPVCSDYYTPCVVAGFEFRDMVGAISMILDQLMQHEAKVEIEYARSVNRDGNTKARDVVSRIFYLGDAQWRGIGTISGSGLHIRDAYARFDAARKYGLDMRDNNAHETRGCRCGDVLRAAITPYECPLFGDVCTPASPAGPCMVSAEGSCAAYYKYARMKNKGAAASAQKE